MLDVKNSKVNGLSKFRLGLVLKGIFRNALHAIHWCIHWTFAFSYLEELDSQLWGMNTTVTKVQEETKKTSYSAVQNGTT